MATIIVCICVCIEIKSISQRIKNADKRFYLAKGKLHKLKRLVAVCQTKPFVNLCHLESLYQNIRGNEAFLTVAEQIENTWITYYILQWLISNDHWSLKTMNLVNNRTGNLFCWLETAELLDAVNSNFNFSPFVNSIGVLLELVILRPWWSDQSLPVQFWDLFLILLIFLIAQKTWEILEEKGHTYYIRGWQNMPIRSSSNKGFLDCISKMILH